jgi:phosphatidylserine/phosphatidylglycerophosphate/cardiolipin synthase-like enzyme
MNNLLFAAFLFTFSIFAYAQDQPVTPPAVPIEVHFSPKGGCTEAVVKELDAAQSTVLLQAYSFTSVPIAKALVESHKRGVKIQVILDQSQRTAKYPADQGMRCDPRPSQLFINQEKQMVRPSKIVKELVSKAKGKIQANIKAKRQDAAKKVANARAKKAR